MVQAESLFTVQTRVRYLPASHRVHALHAGAPASSANVVPPVQSTQKVPALNSLNLPLGQLLQAFVARRAPALRQQQIAACATDRQTDGADEINEICSRRLFTV